MSDCETSVHLITCHCNLQSRMRGFICHAISVHPLFLPSIPSQNNMYKFQNVDPHRHLYIQIKRELRSKYTCDMASHAYKMNDVEKMFWGDTEVYLLQKWFWTISMKFLPTGEENSTAMPCHFTHDLCQAFQL